MVHVDDHTSRCREALSQLLLVTTLMSVDMQRGLETHGLTQARAHVLWELSAAQRMTQRDLADALKVTPRNVTTLIDALEETGFVLRTVHPTDRRATVVVLTQKGQQTVSRLQSEMTRFALLLFGDVPEDDLIGFRAVLQNISDRLTEVAKGQGATPNDYQ